MRRFAKTALGTAIESNLLPAQSALKLPTQYGVSKSNSSKNNGPPGKQQQGSNKSRTPIFNTTPQNYEGNMADAIIYYIFITIKPKIDKKKTTYTLIHREDTIIKNTHAEHAVEIKNTIAKLYASNYNDGFQLFCNDTTADTVEIAKQDAGNPALCSFSYCIPLRDGTIRPNTYYREQRPAMVQQIVEKYAELPPNYDSGSINKTDVKANVYSNNGVCFVAKRTIGNQAFIKIFPPLLFKSFDPTNPGTAEGGLKYLDSLGITE